jgi:gas vesicle protein
VQTAVKRIGELGLDAAGDILDNHPELKNKLGISIDQLKSMGDQYGPEAKKKVEETWQQVQDILKGGIGLGTADQLRRLIQDKIQEVQKMGDQVWQKGVEQVKPYLNKNPKVKELVEQNKDKLMQGSLTELWEKVRTAAMSGDTRDLENFVRQTVEKGKSTAGGSAAGLQQYLNLIPGASEIMPKFEQLQEIAEKHGDEVQKLVKETFKEIQEVLNRKLEEAQKLAEKGTTR